MPLHFRSAIMSHSQSSCFSVQVTPTKASSKRGVCGGSRSQCCLASWVSMERKGTVCARSRAAAEDMMTQLSLFSSSLCVSSSSSQSKHLLQVSSSLWCRAAPCSIGHRMEGDLNSVVTACGGRNPPGSGHHKDFLETWSHREEVGREKQEDSLAASVTFSLHTDLL